MGIVNRAFAHKVSGSLCVLRIALLLSLLLMTVTVFAQDGIKKSKKTETFEGKKYYLHTVEKGQTLYAIARAYEVTVNDIVVENPSMMDGAIKPGDVLRVPFDKKGSITTIQNPPAVDTSKKFIVHKVEAGQTVYSISKKYNVSLDDIYNNNPESRTAIRPGMELKIPVAKEGTANVAIAPDTSKTDSVVSIKKDVYNIALMMPMQLWNVANIEPDDIVLNPPKAEFPQKPQAAVEFYEGALMAIDSMRKAGMKVEVWVYDVDDLDSGKTAGILAKPEFAKMDLIIGPFSAAPFDEIADFANAHNIGIVSPVSQANRVLFKNPMAVKTLPSVGTQMEQLAQHISRERKDDNVILVTSGLLKEQKANSSFRNEMDRLRVSEGKDSIKVNQGFSGIEGKLFKDKMNVLVIPSTSQAFVTDLVRNLYGLAEKYQITVYGMPGWMDYDNLDYEYLEALHFHFAAPYYIDYNMPVTRNFVKRYRSIYGGDPTSFSFAGYDVTLFFLQQLYGTGTGFVPGVTEKKSEGIQQSFSFVRSDAESGYENIGLRIVHFSDYELVPFGFENPKPKQK
jgi:LysM repeat protein/ABC-type branched-subunit amino acid transport system substrate-binding protein